MGMLGKLSQVLGISVEPFNPAELNDPLAMRISWSPIKSGGASFRVQRLVQVGLDRMVFQPTIGAILFGVLFFGIRLAGIVVGAFMLFSKAGPPLIAAIMPFLVG